MHLLSVIPVSYTHLDVYKRQPLQKIVAAIKENNLTAELLRPAKGSVLHLSLIHISGTMNISSGALGIRFFSL